MLQEIHLHQIHLHKSSWIYIFALFFHFSSCFCSLRSMRLFLFLYDVTLIGPTSSSLCHFVSIFLHIAMTKDSIFYNVVAMCLASSTHVNRFKSHFLLWFYALRMHVNEIKRSEKKNQVIIITCKCYAIHAIKSNKPNKTNFIFIHFNFVVVRWHSPDIVNKPTKFRTCYEIPQKILAAARNSFSTTAKMFIAFENK